MRPRWRELRALGVAVGAAAGALIGWAKAAKAARADNDARDLFLEAHGGLTVYHQRLVRLLGTQGDVLTQNLLRAKTADELAAAQKISRSHARARGLDGEAR